MKKYILYFLLFLPLLIASLVNPLLILRFHTLGIVVQKPEGSKVLVSGVESNLVVKSGEKLSMDVIYTLTKSMRFKVELVEGSTLKIDGDAINQNEIVLEPGEHLIQFQTLNVPEVYYPTKMAFLAITPIITRDNELTLTVIVVPRNFETIKDQAIIATIMEVSMVGLSVLFCFQVGISRGFGTDQEVSKELKRKFQISESKLVNLKAKMKSFYELTCDFAEKHGLLEDFQFFMHDKFRLTEGGISELPSIKETQEDEGIVRLSLPHKSAKES